MKKQLRITLVILLVALLGWAGYFFFRTPESEYQGRTLQVWLQEVDFAPGTNELNFQAAVRAIRAIATNAIPTLLNLLTAEEPMWPPSAIHWINDTFNVDWQPIDYRAPKRRI